MELKNIDQTTPIQLIYKPEERVIVQFPDGLQGRAVFAETSHYLEESMRTLGVAIPPILMKEYPELAPRQRAIYLDKPGFGRAFYEIYYEGSMLKDKFVWEKIT